MLHTPGPWLLRSERQQRQSLIAAGMIPIFAPADTTPGVGGEARSNIAMAWVGGIGRPTELALADARLAAAAPELAALLDEWVSARYLDENGDECSAAEFWPDGHRRAAALLARVRGR